jgi:hypothetical protein
MAKRLVGADWFTAKVSAAGMLPELYTLTKHAGLVYLYKELCMDETSKPTTLGQNATKLQGQSPSKNWRNNNRYKIGFILGQRQI